MKHKFTFTIAYWWCMLLVVLGGASLLLGDHSGGVSETENRTLQALPALTMESLMNSTFESELETYLTDQLPGRNTLLTFSSAIRAALSINNEEDLLLNADLTEELEGMNEEDADAEEPVIEMDAADADSAAQASAAPDEAADVSEPADDPYGETEEPLDEDAIYRFRYTRVDGGTSNIMSFGMSAIENTAYTLNQYRDALPDDGTVSFTFVPYSQVANTWLFKPDYYSGWESDVEPVLQSLVDDGVYIYSTVNELESHMQAGENVFFKTDHHWSPLGASYMEQLMFSSLGIPPASYDDYAYTVHEDFRGSIYQEISATVSGSVTDRLEVPSGLAPTHAYVYKKLNELIKEVRYMEPERSSYSAILGGTHTPWYTVITGFHTGRSALVICDSFGNAFIPYLTPYYDAVYQADLRSDYAFDTLGGASIREYIEYYGIDDVYFVVATGCGINSKYMRETVLDYLG